MIHVIIYGFTAQGLQTELGTYVFSSLEEVGEELAVLKPKKPSIVRFLVDIAVPAVLEHKHCHLSCCPRC